MDEQEPVDRILKTVTTIVATLGGIAGVVWGVLKGWRSDRVKIRAEEETAELETDKKKSEIVNRIKMDSAERERQRLEIEARRLEQESKRQEQQIAHYERLLKTVNEQNRNQYKDILARLEDATERIDATQKEHITCREELAKERERGRIQDERLAEQEERINTLELQVTELRRSSIKSDPRNQPTI